MEVKKPKTKEQKNKILMCMICSPMDIVSDVDAGLHEKGYHFTEHSPGNWECWTPTRKHPLYEMHLRMKKLLRSHSS